MTFRGNDPPSDIERLRAVQRALQRLATAAEAPPDTAAALIDWGVHADDAAALSRFSAERTGVYGGLVGRTVLTALHNQLPMTCARIEASALRSTVLGFLAEQAPRSPYLRDVPFEVAIWAGPRWARDASIPGYLPDLARYELFMFAVGTAERGPRPRSGEPLSAERGVWLESTVHLARFDHAVHLLPEGEGDRTEPERATVQLLAYRDSDNDAQTMELTLPAMEILERLAAGTPLGPAIVEAAAALGRAVDPPWIEGISVLLSDLAARGALLGAAPRGEAQELQPETSPYRSWLAKGG
jgi:uncharacterized protein